MRDGIKERYLEDGYVVLENFLIPAEADELKAAGIELTKNIPLETTQSVFSSKNHHKISTDYLIKSSDKIHHFLEEDALDDDGKVKLDTSQSINKIGHALHWLHPLFRCYTYSDRVKQICQELELKVPAVVQSMYIYKNPGVGGVVLPHQDSTYLYTDPIPAVGFWIALDDATLQNGCLWIARGSHKSGVHVRYMRQNKVGESVILDYDKLKPIYPESSFTPLPVKKGTCILLHGHVVHKSAHNRSKDSRHAYTFHVIEKENTVYCDRNWLHEGPGAPWENVYSTEQVV